MLIRFFKYHLLFTTGMLYLQYSAAQQGFGAPVLFQHFGLGTADGNTAGPALPPGRTSFTYSNEVCPPPGSYSIVRWVNSAVCFNGEWIELGSDYTSDYDPDMSLGNMMLVNQAAHDDPLVVYIDTVRGALCPGTLYSFSAALINVDKELPCNSFVTFPVFAFNVENENGQVLFTDTTRGGIGYASGFMGYRFGQFGLRFTMPAGVGRLVVRIVVLPSSANCGEDFAIDDIKVSPAGPIVQMAFVNEPASTIVKSICFQDNRTVTLSGNMSAFYMTPALQWQQSTDNGVTWTDIPGATSNVYTRSFSVPDTFLFRLTGGEATNISNPNCRVISNTRKVEVDGIPADFDATNNSPVCAGQNLQFNATGGASYTWTGPNGFFDNISFPHISSSSLSDSGMYYVQITTLGGCRATDSTYVTMIGTNVDAWPDTAICKGTAVQLRASTGISYEWTPATGLSSTVTAGPKAAPEKTTVYTVKVSDTFGCSDTAHVEVKVKNNTPVKAIIAATDYLCRSYDSASFTDKSLGHIENWYWDFGNGRTSTASEPPVQYYMIPLNRDNFIVKLLVKDTVGCTDSTYHTMKVAENCYIAVPSAFTPNNDGKNDFLYPLNAYKATNLTFRIFNRVGQLVFETRDWTRKWDGKMGGTEQAAGVYVWMLDYTDASKKRISLKGTTVLIR